MRKTICALSVLSALVFVLAVSAAAPVNFAGSWTLDKTKSQGLSSRQQGADSVSWTITQTDKVITVEEKVTGGAMSGGPGGPGGSGGPGRGGFGGPRTYNLDGSETTADMGRGKATRKASWSSDGKTLELSTKMVFQGQDGEVTNTSTEKLQLSADGKTLTAVRHSEGPRGSQDSTYVFTK
jgi:hypothetical protein